MKRCSLLCCALFIACAVSAFAKSLDDILKDYRLETIYETSFDTPLKMIHEEELADGGKTIAREVPAGIDWVLEGRA